MDLMRRIADVLIERGHTTLDDQARALGLPRSTTWTIVKAKHKAGRLQQKVRARMLAHRDLPEEVRILLQPTLTALTVSKRELMVSMPQTAPRSSDSHSGGTAERRMAG